jgi:alpha-N-acetylglucosaminidase
VRKEFSIIDKDPFAWDFDVYRFHLASKSLLNAADELKDNPGYRFDLTNVYRELLQSFTHRFIHRLSVAYHGKDLKVLEIAGNQLFKLLNDLAAIIGTNENFMLGKWLEEAKSWGKTPEEKNITNGMPAQLLQFGNHGKMGVEGLCQKGMERFVFGLL